MNLPPQTAKSKKRAKERKRAQRYAEVNGTPRPKTVRVRTEMQGYKQRVVMTADKATEFKAERRKLKQVRKKFTKQLKQEAEGPAETTDE